MEARRRDVLKLAAFATLSGCARVPLASTAPSSADWKAAMRSRPLLTLRLSTAPTQDIGAGPHGTRVTFPITGGTFAGDRLRGKVLPGGDDWTVTRPDGVIELDLRITLQTDDGALVYMTAEPKYAFLNRLLAVGKGEIRPDGPVHVIEEVL